jgi:hypothetical protein
VAHAVIAWAVWLLLTHVPHVTDTAATLAAGATFGLLAGWRLRGYVERLVRRAVWRLFRRFGLRVSLARGRRR